MTQLILIAYCLNLAHTLLKPFKQMADPSKGGISLSRGEKGPSNSRFSPLFCVLIGLTVVPLQRVRGGKPVVTVFPRSDTVSVYMQGSAQLPAAYHCSHREGPSLASAITSILRPNLDCVSLSYHQKSPSITRSSVSGQLYSTFHPYYSKGGMELSWRYSRCQVDMALEGIYSLGSYELLRSSQLGLRFGYRGPQTEVYVGAIWTLLQSMLQIDPGRNRQLAIDLNLNLTRDDAWPEMILDQIRPKEKLRSRLLRPSRPRVSVPLELIFYPKKIPWIIKAKLQCYHLSQKERENPILFGKNSLWINEHASKKSGLFFPSINMVVHNIFLPGLQYTPLSIECDFFLSSGWSSFRKPHIKISFSYLFGQRKNSSPIWETVKHTPHLRHPLPGPTFSTDTLLCLLPDSLNLVEEHRQINLRLDNPSYLPPSERVYLERRAQEIEEAAGPHLVQIFTFLNDPLNRLMH